MCGSMSPFRHFLSHVDPITLHEPLAEFLGAFDHHETPLEFTFDEVVKMAGHACPTVASAFVCCRYALAKLHSKEIPVRGNIAITIHAKPDDKAYGVIGQVFSFITGASGITGFKGLGDQFCRKDLLTFDPSEADPDSMSFTFERRDTGSRVKARIFPDKFPAAPGQEALTRLMAKALTNSATPMEIREFQDVWMERVKLIVLDEKDIEAWLSVEPT